MFLAREGRRTEGARHLERAADLVPENLSWRLQRAQMRAASGNAAGAIEELKQIVALDPGMIEARRMLSAVLVGTGRTEEAAVQLQALVALTPDDLQARFNLGLMHFESGRYAEARLTLDETLERFPGDVATRHLLARLLAVSPDDAVRDGARAVELAQSVVDEQPALEPSGDAGHGPGRSGSVRRRGHLAAAGAGGGTSSCLAATRRKRLDRLALYQARQPLRAP